MPERSVNKNIKIRNYRIKYEEISHVMFTKK